MEEVNIHGHVFKKFEEVSLKDINQVWLHDESDFPGPQPVSIERKHFSILKKNEYMVGLKNDGERFALCMFEYKGKYLSCLLDRKGSCYLFQATATKQAFSGTLVDCELVDNTLYVLDVIKICGRDVHKMNFTSRLKESETLISCIKSIKHNFTIQKKEFVNLNHFNKLQDNDKIDTDGYIFVPEKEEVQTGTHNTMFKWKPRLQNTVDFALMGNKSYLQNGGKLTWVKIKMKTDQLNCNIPKDQHIVVECEYVGEKHWKVLKVRSDKTLPNSHYTYKKTLINIDENIKENEFTNIKD